MSQWRTLKINEVGRLVTGKTPASSKPECFGDKYPFITPTDMHDCRYASATARHLSKEGAASQKTLKVPAGSVAVSCIGWQMGKSIITTRPSFTNQQLHTILPKDEVDSHFLYYSLCTQRVELLSLGSAAGVRTPIINKSAFGLLSIAVPPLPTQYKIAGILSAYDDLIENNTRRIAILEEMAQAIYREWFVNFRFPGHENVKLVDSPLGQIPEGWEVVPLAECCKLVMGQSPKSEFYNEDGDGLPFHQGVTNFGPRYPSLKTFCTVKNRLADEGDILFSVRAPVGRINIANTQIIVGRGVSAIRRNDDAQVFLFHQLKERFREEDTMGGGTIFKSVTKNDLTSLRLLNPPDDIVLEFESAVGVSFRLYENLTKKNDNLRTTRDLLLPKLISGNLDVEDLDIDLGLTAEELKEATA